MARSPDPTQYPDINALLRLLLAGVRAELGAQFAGMYLYGSLAGGDFDAATSDVDFVVLTRDVLPAAMIAGLAARHAGIAASGLKWAAKLEGSYLALPALRRYDPADTTAWPTLNEGQFYQAPHGWDWVFQRYTLREHGVVLAGPPIAPLIDPLRPTELRQAVDGLLRSWWAGMLADPGRLRGDDYQAYAILSMCRALHTLAHGTVASKPAAARWARQALGAPTDAVIERALAWRPGMHLGAQAEALDLIRFTIEASAQRRAGQPAG